MFVFLFSHTLAVLPGIHFLPSHTPEQHLNLAMIYVYWKLKCENQWLSQLNVKLSLSMFMLILLTDDIG